MGKYGLSVFGVGVYGADDVGTAPADFDVDPFTATPQGYGTVKLQWSTPLGSWSILRIVRSTRGLPSDEIDGTILFDRTAGITPAATDDGLTPGHWYYYSLFLYDTTSSSWVRSGTAFVLVPADYGYTQRLADLLPTVWKSSDLQGIGSTEIDVDSSLYRFLSVFGYTLDQGRTEVDSLLLLTDPNQVAESMLPAALAEFGLTYEPMLGTAAMRKLLRNAVHLYQVKGTTDGIAEFCSAVTGWPVTITVGKNLALDNSMAGFNGGIGLWGGTLSNVTVAWRANDGTITAPVGDGMGAATVTASVTGLGAGISPTTDPLAARLAAIPITAGVEYTGSIYLYRPSVAASSVSGHISLTWLDATGAVLSTTTGSTVTLPINTWERVTATADAPTGAAFVLASWAQIGATAFAIGNHVYFSGFQLEVGATATTWECARAVHIDLSSDLTNEILNPTGAVDLTGWNFTEGDTTATTDGGEPAISWTFNPYGDGAYVDLPGRVAVAPGDIWTFLVELKGNTADRVQLGIRKLYAGIYEGSTGGLVIQSELSPLITPDGTWTQYKLEYTVPLDGSVTELQPNLYYSTIAVGHTELIRNASFQKTTADAAVYFDGGTASSTDDYVWEGDSDESRSLRFRRRSIKIARLTALLPDWMLTQSCYDFEYTGAAQHVPVYLSCRMVFATAEAIVPATDSFTGADGDLTAPWVELFT